MVFGLVCHSLSGSPCRILYSTIYGDDLNQQATEVSGHCYLQWDLSAHSSPLPPPVPSFKWTLYG